MADEPEQDVRRAEFAGDADPGESDDEQDLREHEVAHAQLLPEHRAARFDGCFGLSEWGWRLRGGIRHGQNMRRVSGE